MMMKMKVDDDDDDDDGGVSLHLSELRICTASKVQGFKRIKFVMKSYKTPNRSFAPL